MTFAHFLCRHTHTHTHAKAIPNKSFPESSQEKMHCEKKNISIVSSNERASAFRDDAQTETFGFGMAWVWLQSNQSYSSRMSSSTWWSLVRLARNISLCKKVNSYIYIPIELFNQVKITRESAITTATTGEWVYFICQVFGDGKWWRIWPNGQKDDLLIFKLSIVYINNKYIY